MHKLNISQRQRSTLAAIAGGLAGGILATAIGIPIAALCLLAAAMVGYNYGWRILIHRKPTRDTVIDL